VERQLALVALMAALTAALGLIPTFTLPFGVPITAQTMGIMLCGTILGSRLGALAALLFIGLVALGLPLLAGGRGGLGLFFGPSAGFLLGWPLAAYFAGRTMEAMKVGSVFFRAAWAAVFGGMIVLYMPGIVGMAITLDLAIGEASILSAAFLPGDLAKAGLAGAVTAFLARVRPESVLSLTSTGWCPAVSMFALARRWFTGAFRKK